MVKKFLIVSSLALTLSLALQAADRRTTQGDWAYLQNGSGLRISIETYKAREGWTPVVVSVAGAQVSAVMDGQGRVVHEWAKGHDKGSLPLFTIELEKGRIVMGREAHAIRVYEHNGVRTRLAIAESAIALPLRLDKTGKAGKLGFGGLEIPARIIEVGHTVASPSTQQAGLSNRLAALRPTGALAPSSAARGPRAEAQLTSSRIRARGK